MSDPNSAFVHSLVEKTSQSRLQGRCRQSRSPIRPSTPRLLFGKRTQTLRTVTPSCTNGLRYVGLVEPLVEFESGRDNSCPCPTAFAHAMGSDTSKKCTRWFDLGTPLPSSRTKTKKIEAHVFATLSTGKHNPPLIQVLWNARK